MDIIDLNPDDELDELVIRCIKNGSSENATEADKALMRLALAVKDNEITFEKQHQARMAQIKKLRKWTLIVQSAAVICVLYALLRVILS